MSRVITSEFSMSDLNSMSSQLNSIYNNYEYQEQLAHYASYMFNVFSVPAATIGIAPGVVCITASILSTELSKYYASVQASLTNARNTVDSYKQFLASHPNYNLVKLEITYELETCYDTTYWIPTDFRCTGVHSINPPGWLLPA